MNFTTIIFLIIFCSLNLFAQNDKENSFTKIDTLNIVIDSNMSLEEALSGKKIPLSVKRDLVIVDVYYFSFDEKLHKGQIVVHKEVEQDVIEIFNFIKDSGFPVEKVIPINKYNWSDDASMRDNNTSSFNYRYVSGTKILSMHAQGLAIDINPMQNPYIKNNRISPKGSEYDVSKQGTISADSELVKEFLKRGWSWGGHWKSLKDFQHFQKKLPKR